MDHTEEHERLLFEEILYELGEMDNVRVVSEENFPSQNPHEWEW